MFVLSAALRASGDAWSPLWISGGVNLLNLPLLYVFIFGFWGVPAMGVAGAAIAAGISFSFGSAVLLGLWVRQKFRVRHISGGWWRRARLRALLDIGYPAALEQGLSIRFFIFLMLIGNAYGTEAFAAYNIGVNILAVCMTVGFGFPSPGQPWSVSIWGRKIQTRRVGVAGAQCGWQWHPWVAWAC